MIIQKLQIHISKTFDNRFTATQITKQKIHYNLQLCFCHLINSYIICNILVFIFLGFGKIECRIQITTTHGFLILIFPKSYTMCVHYNFFIIFTTKMFLKSKKDTKSHILERSLQKDF